MKQRASLCPAQTPATISGRDIKNDTLVHMCRSQGHGLWGSLKKQRPHKRVFKQTGLGEVTSTPLIYIMPETRALMALETEVSGTSSVNKVRKKKITQFWITRLSHAFGISRRNQVGKTLSYGLKMHLFMYLFVYVILLLPLVSSSIYIYIYIEKNCEVRRQNTMKMNYKITSHQMVFWKQIIIYRLLVDVSIYFAIMKGLYSYVRIMIFSYILQNVFRFVMEILFPEIVCVSVPYGTPV